MRPLVVPPNTPLLVLLRHPRPSSRPSAAGHACAPHVSLPTLLHCTHAGLVYATDPSSRECFPRVAIEAPVAVPAQHEQGLWPKCRGIALVLGILALGLTSLILVVGAVADVFSLMVALGPLMLLQ